MNATVSYDEKSIKDPVPGVYKSQDHGYCVIVLPLKNAISKSGVNLGNEAFVHVTFWGSGAVEAEFKQGPNLTMLSAINPDTQVEINICNGEPSDEPY